MMLDAGNEDLPVYISTAWYIGIQVFFYDFTYKNMDEVLGGWFTCMLLVMWKSSA